MKEFLEAIEQNEELKAKVTELDVRPDAKIEDYIALAKEYGFTLTEEDFIPTKGVLNDEELAAVSGGKSCFCAIGGGGTGDGDKDGSLTELTCACAIGGGGEFTYLDEKHCRCFCMMGGTGDAINWKDAELPEE